jgi:hypothetical protein
VGITTAASKLPAYKNGFRFVTKSLVADMPEGDGESRRRFHTIASSTIKDLGKDEMLMTALEEMRDQFRAGVPMFMNHSYTLPQDSFGVSDKAWIEDSGVRTDEGAQIWDLHVAGFVDEANDRAVQLHESIHNGMKFGASVGVIVKAHKRNAEGGRVIAHLDTKEASIVGIAQNQRSWVQKAVSAITGAEDEDEGDEPSEAVLEAPAAIVEPEAVEKAADPVENKALDTTTGAPLDRQDLKTKKADIVENAVCKKCGGGVDSPQGGCDAAFHTGDTDNDGDDPKHGKDPDHDNKGAEPLLDADAVLDLIVKGSASDDTHPGGQEADAATPETTPADSTAADPALEQKALVFEPEDVVALVKRVDGLVRAVGERDERIATLTAALSMKDDELTRHTVLVKELREQFTAVAAMPLRPRAVLAVKSAADTLARGFYPEVADTLTQMLKEKDA